MWTSILMNKIREYFRQSSYILFLSVVLIEKVKYCGSFFFFFSKTYKSNKYYIYHYMSYIILTKQLIRVVALPSKKYAPK